MKPASVLAPLLALALCGCADPAPPAAEIEPAPAGQAGVRYADAGRAAGLDGMIQTGGAPEVDHIIDSVGCGAAFLDYDGDGDADLYLAQGATREAPRAGPPDRLLRNDGDGDGDGIPEFSDAGAAAGLGDRLWSVGVAAADYDNDGDTDLYLTNWGANRLYRNDGDGRFSEIGAAAGVDDGRWGASAAWSDVDRDGDLDLYVTNYVEFDFDRYPARGERPAGNTPPCVWKGAEIFCGPRTLEPAADVFFRNDGDPDGDGVPRFVDATREAGLLPDEPMFSLAAHFFDADGDGDDDLYVANDSVQNLYFVNRGDGRFDEVSILAGVAYNEQGMEQAGMGVASADFDGDGKIDLAVSNFSHDHDTLYRNEGELLFSDVSYPAGIGSASWLTLGWGIAFLDADLDGWEDLFVAHGHVYPQIDDLELGSSFRQANTLFMNRRDGTFEAATAAGAGLELIKSSRAVLPVDLEGDGDVDLLVTNLNDAPSLLLHEGADGGWLSVRLRGTSSNRDGIGALVLLEAGGRRQLRQVRRQVGYAGSTLPLAHFGIGAATTVDRVTVRWPSGAVSVVDDVEPGRLLLVVEPSDAENALDEETLEELKSLGYIQ